MIDPLAPRPMSPAEVADLVERTRASMAEVSEQALKHAVAVRDERLRSSRLAARVIARLAYLERISVAQAARDVRLLLGVKISVKRAHVAFHDVYPDVEIRYRSGSRCVEAARVALAEGITSKAAGDRFGLSKSGVAKAIAKLRSA